MRYIAHTLLRLRVMAWQLSISGQMVTVDPTVVTTSLLEYWAVPRSYLSNWCVMTKVQTSIPSPNNHLEFSQQATFVQRKVKHFLEYLHIGDYCDRDLCIENWNIRRNVFHNVLQAMDYVYHSYMKCFLSNNYEHFGKRVVPITHFRGLWFRSLVHLCCICALFPSLQDGSPVRVPPVVAPWSPFAHCSGVGNWPRAPRLD